jgi:hypothetical protein
MLLQEGTLKRSDCSLSRGTDATAVDGPGFSALHYAVQGRIWKIIQLLLEVSGFDVDVRTPGDEATALMYISPSAADAVGSANMLLDHEFGNKWRQL